ncbi:MAG: hypothetical protein MUC48_03460 [Leptolyngbya sp. Prado105]|nr:hypothetical protein [Leptolyngbya sp. Prado105]
MSTSRYWILIRLNAAGQAIPKYLPLVKAFFQQQIDLTQDPRQIQTQLLALSQTSAIAQLCLRCYVSYQILSTCIRLVQQFGNRYGFTLSDILPYVLDDRGDARFSETVACRILKTFQPDRGSLNAWIVRLVRQHPELTKFLAQQGLLLISDWALLNDTTETQLQRILSEVYSLSPFEISQAIALLRAYHAVGCHKHRGRCIPPSITQLDQIRQYLASDLAPDTILSRLQHLAHQVRQYRIQRRQGSIHPCSIDVLLIKSELAPEEEPELQFLRRYQQALETELDQAIREVVETRIQRDSRFLFALRGLYCDQLTTTAIAQQLGLSGQDRVVRLLQLPRLRSQIQHQLIQRLMPRLFPLIPQPLINLEQILQDHLESLFHSDAKYLRTPVSFRRTETRSLFTLRMRHCLDRTFIETRSICL